MLKLRTIIPLFLFLASTLVASGPRVRPWEHETSDVSPSQRIHFGALENGLRFAWMSNPEPDQRCYVRLQVRVGSLMEEDSERGMAHFLEHMAFNGTRHFPPGTMIEWFQNQGMSFGADTNASTSFDETIYKLDLPTSDAEKIGEGLRVLRDFADGATLDPEEIEKEKGVVDAEERERDSAGFRAAVRQLRIQFDGTRVPERIPIGTKEVRARFTSESVRRFYTKWYRPDAMTLVIVGDLGNLDPEGLIRKFFSDMPAPISEYPSVPRLGYPSFKQPYFAIQEEEIPTAQINLSLSRPWVDEPDNSSTRTKYLPLTFARNIVNLRFSELVKKEGASFLGASVGSSDAFRIVEGESLSIVSDPPKWKQALAAADHELRRALQYGFQSAEFEEVRARYLRSLDESVEREPTRSSQSWASTILSAANNRVVPSDAETGRSIRKPAVQQLTFEECHRALVQFWSQGQQTLSILGNVGLGDAAPAVLESALLESRLVKVEPLPEIDVATFAYRSSSDKVGEVKERRFVEDLDFYQFEFVNGVRVNVKKTNFKEKQILMSVRLGEGLLTLEPDIAAPLSLVAGQIFVASGLRAHSADELRRINAGKRVGVGFNVGQDAFSFGGATTREDLLYQCELVTAYLEHPGWREEGDRLLKAFLPQFYEGLKHRHQGPIQTDYSHLLHAGDRRFGLPSQDQLESVGVDQVKEWLTPYLRSAPLEVTFVGDLDVEETLQATVRTFGILPPRRESMTFEGRRQTPAPVSGLNKVYSVETEVPKSLVLIYYPTVDGIDSSIRRSLFFLSQVIDDRLRIAIREKLGASYSPSAGSDANRVFPGVGFMTVRALADPDKVETLKTACLDVLARLASEGVTEEEVERLRKPTLAQLRDSLRTNSLWLQSLNESQARPETIEDLRTLISFYETVDAETLSRLAGRYLGKDKASLAVVNPTG